MTHDFAHCNGEGCARRDTCRRYTDIKDTMDLGAQVAFVEPSPNDCKLYKTR